MLPNCILNYAILYLEVLTRHTLNSNSGSATASERPPERIRLASDSINVIRIIQETAMGVYGHIVQKIKTRMKSFISAKVVHEGKTL